jgi:hypothetical protein
MEKTRPRKDSTLTDREEDVKLLVGEKGILVQFSLHPARQSNNRRTMEWELRGKRGFRLDAESVSYVEST